MTSQDDSTGARSQEFRDLVQQLLQACHAQWEDAQLREEQVQDALKAAGQRLCERLTVALQVECILPDTVVSYEEAGFRTCSSLAGTAHSSDALTFKEIATLLASSCGHEAPRQLAEELHSCVVNDAIALLFQRYVWCARDIGNLWRYVYSQRRMGPAESLNFWEAFASFTGHPTHVVSKSKVCVDGLKPLDLNAVQSYSAEFGLRVPLSLLAARCDVIVAFPSAEAWQDFWSSKHPEAVATLSKEVGEANASGYMLLWVHPLNKQNLQRVFATQFQEGSLRFLDAAPEGCWGLATMSFRTLDMCEGYHLKLPVPIQITSWPRYVSPVEIQESAVISRLLPELDLPEKLVLLSESCCCHLSYEFTGGTATYEQARYCSMLTRESPARHLKGGHCLVPLAAAFSRAPSGRSLFEEIWEDCGIGSAEVMLWFTSYVAVVAECQIVPLLRYGFTIEAHQQNGMVELGPDGRLARLFCREIGGGIEWDLERLKAFPDLNFVEQLYPRQDIFTGTRTCHTLLRHTMLESHLLPLARICTDAFGIDISIFFETIRSEIRSAISSVRQAPKDAWDAARFGDYASLLQAFLLEDEQSQGKALLRMRLQNTKDYIFVTKDNPLCVDSDAAKLAAVTDA